MGAFFDALGRPAGGGGDQDRLVVGPQYFDDGPDNGRLARARAAGDDGQPVLDRGQRRLLLFGGELQGQLGKNGLEIDGQLRHGKKPLGQLEQAPGRGLFDQLVLGLEDADLRGLGLAQLRAFQQLFQNGVHVAVGDVQQPGTFLEQFVPGDEQVALLEFALLQDEKDPGPDALAVELVDAHGPGDGVGDLEAHAAHLLDQQVGVAFDQRQRQVAEFAVNAEDRLLADAVRGQAHGQVAQDPAVAHALLDGFDDRLS